MCIPSWDCGLDGTSACIRADNGACGGASARVIASVKSSRASSNSRTLTCQKTQHRTIATILASSHAMHSMHSLPSHLYTSAKWALAEAFWMHGGGPPASTTQ